MMMLNRKVDQVGHFIIVQVYYQLIPVIKHDLAAFPETRHRVDFTGRNKIRPDL